MNTLYRHARWPRWIAIIVLFGYCTYFLVNYPNWFPESVRTTIQQNRAKIFDILNRTLEPVVGSVPRSEAVMAAYLLVFAGVLPLFLSRITGRRLVDVGWQTPNALALRYFLVALCIATPFLLWMVQSPTIAKPYLNQLHRMGFLLFAGFYVINMLTEHLLLHGVVLGLARPDGRWPAPSQIPLASQGSGRVLRWLGMAMPDADNLTQWLGLAPGCLFPMVFSALLFGLVHLGKDNRELILAFPGGLAQAYIAYRSNSWLTPFAIHLATASMALAMMVLTK